MLCHILRHASGDTLNCDELKGLYFCLFLFFVKRSYSLWLGCLIQEFITLQRNGQKCVTQLVQVSNTSATNSLNWNVFSSRLCPNHCSQVLIWEWRSSWSSAFCIEWCQFYVFAPCRLSASRISFQILSLLQFLDPQSDHQVLLNLFGGMSLDYNTNMIAALLSSDFLCCERLCHETENYEVSPWVISFMRMWLPYIYQHLPVAKWAFTMCRRTDNMYKHHDIHAVSVFCKIFHALHEISGHCCNKIYIVCNLRNNCYSDHKGNKCN